MDIVVKFEKSEIKLLEDLEDYLAKRVICLRAGISEITSQDRVLAKINMAYKKVKQNHRKIINPNGGPVLPAKEA